MPFLSDEEKLSLKIEKMIFHVVGPEQEDAVILSEFDPPVFTEFFLARIKSALGGNLYFFKENSAAKEHLEHVENDPTRFGRSSEELARLFQHEHRKTTNNGAFFLFLLSVEDGTFIHALVKIDNDNVLKYDITDDGNEQRAVLDELTRTFSTNAESVQKIALVRFSEEDSEIVVRDRTKRDGISEYFEKFLNVRRKGSPGDFTKRIENIFKKVLKAHKDEVDPELYKSGARIINERLRNTHEFGPDNHDSVFNSIFGVLPEDSPIRKTFKRNLSTDRLDEETFTIDPEAIPAPRKKRIETREGIKIFFEEEQRAWIEKRRLDNGQTQIIIRTEEVVVDDDDALGPR